MSLNYSKTMNLALNYLYKVFLRPFPHIQLTPVTTKEIIEIIKFMWLRLVKISLAFIKPPLTHICNKPLSTGIYPT
jgi:hypothetical protein